MPKITFITYDGLRCEVEAPIGYSMLDVAVAERVPGLDAECGGQCSCATCHVIVDDKWFPAVGPASAGERAMLSLMPELCAHSRLACQIQLDQRLDGIVVRVPEFQM